MMRILRFYSMIVSPQIFYFCSSPYILFTRTLYTRSLVQRNEYSYCCCCRRKTYVSGTAGKNAAVQLLPLIEYTLLQLRCCSTGMLVLPSFLLPCFAVLLLHMYIWGGRARSTSTAFCRNGVVVYIVYTRAPDGRGPPPLRTTSDARGTVTKKAIPSAQVWSAEMKYSYVLYLAASNGDLCTAVQQHSGTANPQSTVSCRD